MAEKEDVYCTLVMNDAYLPGAAVLAHSLRDAGSKKKLACLIVQDGLRASTIEQLQTLYNHVIPVERIGNPNPANLYLMNRPDLLYTFTKINLWRLTQFRKILYVDSDVVALRAPEELFDLPDEFAAAPDVGWPDAFNTGVMLLTPSAGEYNALRGLANAGDSFDGADQGLLNQYFEHKPWKRLSFTYNTTPSASYQYEPAYRYYKRDISMVHFIGGEKPWHKDRSPKNISGAFQELLSRWWAVWDRHIEVSPADYVNGQLHPVTPAAQGSFHHQTQTDLSATGYPVESAEPMMSEPSEIAEDISQGHVKPTSTTEQRRFSAPFMEWDATRGAPPLDAKPEAAHFPTQTYEFNNDPHPFRPPPSYPEPPKNMWYEVPSKAKEEEKLKPIFPWEEHADRRPTRRFVEDEQPPPSSDHSSPGPSYADELEVSSENYEPFTPTIKINDDIPWQSLGQNRNAWDEVTGIDDYVRQLTAFQKNRGKVQVVQTHVPSTDALPHIFSPTAELDPVELVDSVAHRRASLIVTHFPTATERPSLPVTPAPRRRPSFWGEERDTDGDLPPADGVPDQAEWDPSTQLEQLRRNSLIGPGDLKLPPQKKLSQREMPSSAAAMPEAPLGQPPPPALSSPPVSILKTSSAHAGNDARGRNATLATSTQENTAINAGLSATVAEPPNPVAAVDEMDIKQQQQPEQGMPGAFPPPAGVTTTAA